MQHATTPCLVHVLAVLMAIAGLPAVAAAQTPSTPLPPVPAGMTRTYGLSLVNELDLPANFTHFPYADPMAPKGGEVSTAAIGTFDSFNPFIVRGTPAAAAARVYDSLMARSADEPESAYVHVARAVEIADDHKSIAFDIRPEARFNDGHPLTSEDVVWTFDKLREEGRPFFRQYYADVEKAEADGPLRVVFRFKTDKNRELGQILGEMPILPKHWWVGRDFDRPLTDPPLGSGPYRIGRYEMGRTMVLDRVPDYWGAYLPTTAGLNNFDHIRTEYFRDATVALEAFKAGQVDWRMENISKNWATAYDFPAVTKGLVKKESLERSLPTGMQAFAMNTRRAIFSDRRVREALGEVFDFEWMNKNLFYGAYARTESYFSSSDYASSGLPVGPELAILGKYRDKLPPSVFSRPFKLRVTDGSGNNREGLRRAVDLFKEAGWNIVDHKLVDSGGHQFSFEILLNSPGYERVALPYVQSLQRLGMDVRVRTVDPAQYQRLMDSFDYDMTDVVISQSDSPGNEQVEYWSCATSKVEGSSNTMGVCDPVVDALVAGVLAAHDHKDLIVATRALDRVLLAGYYVVPNWHSRSVNIAYWDRFGYSPVPVRSGVELGAWWVDAARAAITDRARSMGQ